MIIKIPLVLMLSFSGVLSLMAQNITYLRYLDYPQSIFDSDTCCWRLMSSNDSYAEAADLMKAYLRYHQRIENRHSLHWPLGQLLAMAGQYKEAKTYFKKNV